MCNVMFDDCMLALASAGEKITEKYGHGQAQDFAFLMAAAKFVQKSEPFEYFPIKVEQEKISVDSQLFFLEGLFQVSEKKAKILLDHFKTPYKVLQGIMETEIIYTKSGKPKGISGKLGELKGFGHKFLKINKELLENPF